MNVPIEFDTIEELEIYIGYNGITIHSIRCLNIDTRTGNTRQFVEALKLCLSLSIDVLHLSIGSSYFKDFPTIKETINKLIDSGTLIVAALNNKRIITYPACLPNVIGVKTHPELKDTEYVYHNPSILTYHNPSSD